MGPSSISTVQNFRPQLLLRRERLQAAAGVISAADLNLLLGEIDDALRRIETGRFGLCETCHDPIEPDRLEQNPLVRFCLDHLNQAELQAHQEDLDLAMKIQLKLLPPKAITLDKWDTHFRYEPAGAVGGDYCELTRMPDNHSIFFAVGDVAGKGVAASLLMTHLSAIFRSLLSLDLPLAEVVSRANRLFCESTTASQYATLACGRATPDYVELCNAGHCTPLILRSDGTERFEATGLPLGLFCGGHHAVRQIPLAQGDSLILYSDGITEAQNSEGIEFGEQRLLHSLRNHQYMDPGAMADEVLGDVARFRGTQPANDDVTLLILRRCQC